VLRNISLDVKKGEFVSIIGKSGCGKSTLFKLIGGLLGPNAGAISINGKIVKVGEIGYMPQKDLLLPWRTVIENILLPVEIAGEDLKLKSIEIRYWLNKFGLSEIENCLPHHLSGGMKQRVAFLRTLMTKSEILLLDEPFGALDSITKREMHCLLLRVLDDLQKAVLFITHDLEEAILLSDRIYLLNDKVNEISVDFPKPRSVDLIYNQKFINLRKDIERQIQYG
jgi:putative hydroxymethylpyrimidine transport system ATP-binding protein